MINLPSCLRLAGFFSNFKIRNKLKTITDKLCVDNNGRILHKIFGEIQHNSEISNHQTNPLEDQIIGDRER